jgi:addiction module HigA family antidote
MVQYNTNPTRLSKDIKASPTNFRNILDGKTKISAKTAQRLAKYFDTTPQYWLTLQTSADLAAASQDKELSSILKGIVRAKKPAPGTKASKSPTPKKSGKKPLLSAPGKKTAPKPPAKAGRKPRTKKT